MCACVGVDGDSLFMNGTPPLRRPIGRVLGCFKVTNAGTGHNWKSCLFDHVGGRGVISPVSLAVLGPSTTVRITRNRANTVDTRNIMRQGHLHCAAGREQKSQAVFESRQNIVGQSLHQVQQWAFRRPPLVGQTLHLHTYQFIGMITSLG